MAETNCVINNLLCYVSSSLTSYDKDLITHQAASYYNENVIVAAKSVLCANLNIKPIWKRGDEKLRKEMIDIVDLVIKAKDSGTLPRYVADSYDAFPPLNGYETIANHLGRSIREIYFFITHYIIVNNI